MHKIKSLYVFAAAAAAARPVNIQIEREAARKIYARAENSGHENFGFEFLHSERISISKVSTSYDCPRRYGCCGSETLSGRVNSGLIEKPARAPTFLFAKTSYWSRLGVTRIVREKLWKSQWFFPLLAGGILSPGLGYRSKRQLL